MAIRLDLYLVANGLCESREKSKQAILAGWVLVNGILANKPSHLITADDKVSVTTKARFVSRGGEKLDAALTQWNLNVTDLVCLDCGASTGGFTDCLLQRGAAKVYAVDVGSGQLHASLKENERVVLLEKTHLATATTEQVYGNASIKASFCAIDVSFISVTHILKNVASLVQKGSDIVVLVKPQFELESKGQLKHGIVKNLNTRLSCLEKVKRFAVNAGCVVCSEMESPILGGDGNQEYLLHLRTA